MRYGKAQLPVAALGKKAASYAERFGRYGIRPEHQEIEIWNTRRLDKKN